MKEKVYRMLANQYNPAVKLENIIYKAKCIQKKANQY